MKIVAFTRIASSFLMAACATSHQDQVTPASKATGAKQPSVQSSISEEEFKAMHVLRTDNPPPLAGSMIEIAGSKAYLSLPAKPKSSSAGIVMIHEWWGLNDHIKHWADRLANEGYAVVAVDLYDGVVATTPDDAMRAMKAVDPDKAVTKMRAAHRFLVEDARVKAQHTGSLGWCFGGRMSLLAAINEPELDATVMYYGPPITDAEALRKIHAPVLAIFGTRDASITADNVKAFDQALEQAGKQHKVLRYDAEHAFANPSNPHYDEKSASEAWSETKKFFAEHL